MVATVRWSNRPALVAWSFRTDECDDATPGAPALTLVAPASRERASSVAVEEQVYGVALPMPEPRSGADAPPDLAG